MVRWQKQVFIHSLHTRLSRAYLALARLSCYSIRKYSTSCEREWRPFHSGARDIHVYFHQHYMHPVPFWYALSTAGTSTANGQKKGRK